MAKLFFLGFLLLLFYGCIAEDTAGEEQMDNYNKFVNQQQVGQEKEETEKALESALPLISTEYDDSVNYSLIYDEQFLAMFYLSKARLGILICQGCDESYRLGLDNTITALWYESEGISHEANYHIALQENKNTTEERAQILNWAVSSREKAVESYESLLSDYPEYAEDIDATHRLETINTRLGINKRQLED